MRSILSDWSYSNEPAKHKALDFPSLFGPKSPYLIDLKDKTKQMILLGDESMLCTQKLPYNSSTKGRLRYQSILPFSASTPNITISEA